MPSLANSALSWLVLLRRLPGYLPFMPLILRSIYQRGEGPTVLPLPLGEATDALTPQERDWLTLLVRRTPETAVIVQAGAPDIDVTCALAAGCWASQRRVFAVWPDGDEVSSAFRIWHQTVIRQGLAPYVTPVSGLGNLALQADLIYSASLEGLASPAKPGAVLISRRRETLPERLPGQFDHCGTLTASYFDTEGMLDKVAETA
jgi:hypothetical protein